MLHHDSACIFFSALLFGPLSEDEIKTRFPLPAPKLLSLIGDAANKGRYIHTHFAAQMSCCAKPHFRSREIHMKTNKPSDFFFFFCEKRAPEDLFKHRR